VESGPAGQSNHFTNTPYSLFNPKNRSKLPDREIFHKRFFDKIIQPNCAKSFVTREGFKEGGERSRCAKSPCYRRGRWMMA
jgi:hypothetical protein